MKEDLILVLATRNQGKTREIQDIFKGRPVVLKNLNDYRPISEVKEDGRDFEENAYKKASFVASALGIPSLADDSGLVVHSLNGAPGVHSARYAGINATDQERNQKLLSALMNVTDRRAYFESVISIAAPSGHALTFQGRCEGVITKEPIGTNGFGYDPVFFYPPLKKTFAEMSLEEKSQVSHRGKALNEVLQELDKIIVWLNRIVPHANYVLNSPVREGCKKGLLDRDN